ncbi:MAG TPA: gliding motility-associated C-terminal domain-containing protein, partial [Bacteroidales bacterium]|nr:gliding motility-associated C-terminal domain-containing protein [Bacteroidales bacterium]
DNISPDKQLVQYTITPWTINNNDNNECSGTPIVVDIWVEPTARVFTTIVNDTLCNTDNVIITMVTPNVPTIGIEFNLEIINNYPEVSGYTPRYGMVVTDVINESITNTGDTARMIEYVFKPALLDPYGNQKCPGVIDTVKVWINPTPRVIPVVLADKICFGESTEVELTTPTVMTHGLIRFDYTVSVTGLPGDVTGDTNPGNDLPPGYIIMFNYDNNTDTVQSVYYYTLPRSVGTGCAAGIIETSEVKIHPIPIHDIIVTNPLTCGGGSDLALSAIVSRGTEPLAITWTGPFGFSAYDVLDISGRPGGLYTATVTDNLGCYGYQQEIHTKAPISLVFDPVIEPTYFMAHTTCIDSDDGKIFIFVESGGDYPYNYWLLDNDGDTLVTGILSNTYNTLDPLTYDTIYNLPPGRYELYVRDLNGCYGFRDTYVFAPLPITANFELSDYTGYNISCKTYYDGKIKATINGGVGDYVYFWYTFDGSITGDNTLDSIINLPSGTYYLRVTDGLGCVMIDSVTLKEPEGITLVSSTLSLSPDGNFNISCYNYSDGSIDPEFEGGSGNMDYDWTGPFGSAIVQGQEDQEGLISGLYTLIVTDENGCTRQFDYDLTQPDTLELVFNPTSTPDGLYNIFCNGGTADVDLTATGGSTTGYQYTWTTETGSGIVQSSEDQTGLTAGTYYTTVTDLNGCSVDDSIVLTEPEPLTLLLTPVNITCEEPGMDNGTIDLSISGGGAPYSFSWSNGSSSQNQAGLTEGRYYVIVTDIYGCQIEDSVDILLPPPLILNKTISDYNGFNISCFGVDDGWISIEMTSGDSPFIYSWTGTGGFTSSEGSISDLVAGQYIISITDMNQCTVSDTTILSQQNQIGIDVDVSLTDYGGFNINCYGDSTGTIDVIPVNSIGNTRYFWTDGNQNKFRDNLSAGAYGLLIVDDNNCSRDTIIELTQPEPIVITATVEQPYCIDMPDGAIILSTQGGYAVSDYYYLWWDNRTSSTIGDVSAGQYRVIVTDDNGCSETDTIIVTSEKNNCLTIPNAISPNGDNINDVWNIDLIDLYPDAEIKIFNRWGELVWASEKGYPQPWNGTSRGRMLPIDSYHYIIDLNNGTQPIVGHITIIR